MQNSNGQLFRDILLSWVLKKQIINDKTKNSTHLKLQKALEKNIDWDNGYYLASDYNNLKEIVFGEKLPKIDRF